MKITQLIHIKNFPLEEMKRVTAFCDSGIENRTLLLKSWFKSRKYGSEMNYTKFPIYETTTISILKVTI